MTYFSNLTLAAPREHLRQLSLIRSILLGALWLALLIGIWRYELDTGLLLYVLAVFSLLQLMTRLRLRNPLPVTELECAVHLLLDILLLGVWFYASGGGNNPFIFYLLVPVCMGAAILPGSTAWLITATSLVTYSLLLFYYREFALFSVSHQHQHQSWHILGMGFNFFISALLITYFVKKMAGNLRQQEAALSRLREDELRNQQLLAVATLAAATAHEINTPLGTMTLLLDELRAQYPQEPELLADIDLLSQQVSQCAQVLKRMVSEATAANQGDFPPQPLRQFCAAVIDRWQLLRPSIQYQLTLTGDQLDNTVSLDPRLEYAIMNLLNNAADASPEQIELRIHCNNHSMHWQISDSGEGIDPELVDHMGKAPLTTKPQGLGLGLLITRAILQYYGGRMSQSPNQPRGTITELWIPLNAGQLAP